MIPSSKPLTGDEEVVPAAEVLTAVAGDNGLAFGAALLYCALEDCHPKQLSTASLGPAYSTNDVRKSLDEVGAPFKEISDPAACAGQLLAAGKIIVLWRTRAGSSLYIGGPSNRGNEASCKRCRKIPRGFRPFAPSVAEEAANQFFVNGHAAPYMTFTFDARQDMGATMPAVTHVDGTARVQTVSQSVEPTYHALLMQFAK
jgi:carbamoyltransferase